MTMNETKEIQALIDRLKKENAALRANDAKLTADNAKLRAENAALKDKLNNTDQRRADIHKPGLITS